MLRFRQISLYQFKNYSSRQFLFQGRITGICGNNGAGKTNLLDAIHYLCFTRSYFTRTDSFNVRQGEEGFRLEGVIELQGEKEKTVCVLRETGKKEFSVNDKIYDKLSAHIGRYPCVVIAPDDAELITGDSRERRKFLDTLLSQFDQEYLQNLIRYRRLLDQRNSLLKNFAETGRKDLSLLDVIDQQMITPGDRIFQRRRDFTISMLPRVKELYQSISMQPEDVSLYYESELMHASMAELFAVNRNRDLLAQRTFSGIHRDDLDLQLAGQPFRTIASQGQRKSLLFALKLAEMEILGKEKDFPPLLLLDDVFEKLDEERILNLLRKVCVENEGQVFITDTHAKRLSEHLEKLDVAFEMIML